MKRYLIAHKNDDFSYSNDNREIVDVRETKALAIDLISNIISDPYLEIVSVVQYDFESNISKVLKVILDNQTKLDLVEDEKQ